jgi:hypothetical protein
MAISVPHVARPGIHRIILHASPPFPGVRHFCVESDKVGGVIVRNRINSDVRARADLTEADEGIINELYRGLLVDDGIKCDGDRARSEQQYQEGC